MADNFFQNSITVKIIRKLIFIVDTQVISGPIILSNHNYLKTTFKLCSSNVSSTKIVGPEMTSISQ